jgi:hypothetical protein
MRWPFIVAPVVVFVLLLVSVLVVAPGRSGAEWEQILELAVRATSLPFVAVALAAVCIVFRGGDGARGAALAAALSLLAVALIWSTGGWATPIAIAVCGVAWLFAPRVPSLPPPPST